MAGGWTAAAEDQNKGPEPRLLKSGARRDSGTQRLFPSAKPARGPRVPKSSAADSTASAAEGGAGGSPTKGQSGRITAASYTESYSVGWEQLRRPSWKLN